MWYFSSSFTLNIKQRNSHFQSNGNLILKKEHFFDARMHQLSKFPLFISIYSSKYYDESETQSNLGGTLFDFVKDYSQPCIEAEAITTPQYNEKKNEWKIITKCHRYIERWCTFSSTINRSIHFSVFMFFYFKTVGKINRISNEY